MSGVQWKAAELGSLVMPVKAWSPVKEAPNERLVYVDLSSVDRKTKEIVAPQGMTGAEAPSRARQLLKAGDVLISTVRPNLNAVAVVPGDLDRATGSTGFCVLRADSQRLDKRYLFHWVRSPAFIASMVRRATGASYPAVSDRIVKQMKIPLPPLAEQRRIAAILDKADAVRRKRQQTLDLADQFLRSAFLDLFGELSMDTSLGELCAFSQGIQVPVGKQHTRQLEGDVRFLRIIDYTQETEPRYIAFPGERYQVCRDDIAMVRYGASAGHAGIGKVGVIANNLFKVDFNKQVILPAYLYFCLKTDRFRLFIEKNAFGAAMPALSFKMMGRYPLAAPPLKLQSRFATIAKSIERQKAHHRAHLAELDALFASLEQRAFRGEL